MASLLSLLGRSGFFQNKFGLLGINCLSAPLALKNVDPWAVDQPNTLLGGVRYKRLKPSNKFDRKDPKGIHYFGFTYFPRFPDHKDPPIEPTKLFMVKRIRSLYGCPHWEKRWVHQFGLDDRRKVVIVKNTPSKNRELYRIKHLIEITPITVPYGMPDSPKNGFLKENGEFVSYNLLKEHGDSRSPEEADQEIKEFYQKNMDIKTLKKRLHTQWHTRYDIVH